MATSLKQMFQKMAERVAAEWSEKQPAWLGDFAGTVNTSSAGVLYARLINGKVVKVHNSVNVPPTFDLHVMIGKNRNIPNLWQIIRVIEDYDVPAAGGQIAYHEAQHRFGAGDMIPIDRKQIVALTAIVSDPAGFIVKVYGSLVRTATGMVQISTQDVDLSGEAVTAGAIFVNIESNDAGTLSINAGTAFGAKALAAVTDIPVPAAGKYLVATALLYDSQTELADDDIRVPMPLGTAYHGDMTKAVYDTDDDGTVDNSEQLGGVIPTAAGLALLDDADAAAQHATLGLGNSATRDVGTGSGNVAVGDHSHTSGGQYRQFTWASDGAGGWGFVSSGAEPVLHLEDLE